LREREKKNFLLVRHRAISRVMGNWREPNPTTRKYSSLGERLGRPASRGNISPNNNQRKRDDPPRPGVEGGNSLLGNSRNVNSESNHGSLLHSPETRSTDLSGESTPGQGPRMAELKNKGGAEDEPIRGRCKQTERESSIQTAHRKRSVGRKHSRGGYSKWLGETPSIGEGEAAY